jgi:tRNA dimethylallyltransferase
LGPDIFILGQTCTSKHKIALNLAERLGGEIISIDSMKVYREMDIGTAKPPKEDLLKLRHHLINILDPHEVYSAGRFVRDAKTVREQIRSRGRLPIFVGGTLLYYKAYTYGIFEGAPRSEELRKDLQRLAEEKGSLYLHEELRKIDPEAAKRINPNDLKRIIRALEVFKLTGSPISSLWGEFDRPKMENFVILLRCDPGYLRRRIEERTKVMIRTGLVEEVKKLSERPLGWSKEARDALGYKEILEYLRGNLSLGKAIENININTSRFARRQLVWLKRFKEGVWMVLEEGAELKQVVEKILLLYKK